MDNFITVYNPYDTKKTVDQIHHVYRLYEDNKRKFYLDKELKLVAKVIKFKLGTISKHIEQEFGFTVRNRRNNWSRFNRLIAIYLKKEIFIQNVEELLSQLDKFLLRNEALARLYSTSQEGQTNYLALATSRYSEIEGSRKSLLALHSARKLKEDVFYTGYRILGIREDIVQMAEKYRTTSLMATTGPKDDLVEKFDEWLIWYVSLVNKIHNLYPDAFLPFPQELETRIAHIHLDLWYAETLFQCDAFLQSIFEKVVQNNIACPNLRWRSRQAPWGYIKPLTRLAISKGFRL